MYDDDAPRHDRPPRTPFGPRRQKTGGQSAAMAHADAAVQTSPPSAPPTFLPPPPLPPPPAVSFEPTPIPWKGLPLDAAQWTFSSAELQEIVSSAIRLSARDSFVRLLSLQTLQVDIVHESQRLDTARLEAQAKWRFESGRRTMLMQALNAAAAVDQGATVLSFVAQLATAVASCDSLLSTVLQLAEQQSQIALIQHQHWASALGMALRKLNKAYDRQAQELKRAQTRVHTLEDELEEAWREAEKMAIEFDDLEQEIADTESDGVPMDLDLKNDLDETGTLGDVTIHTDFAVVLGVTATAVASKATLVTSPKPIESDTKSVRSVKSTRSRRDGQSHFSRLSSARLRSRAASNASLRLPKALRSTPATHPSPTDIPPLPSPTAHGHSFLDMDNGHPHKIVPPKRHPEPTLALPSPPHSAGLPPTRVPSIWLESDETKNTHTNGFDRSHSLQIFPSLPPRRVRRSNLVMSLTGSDHTSDTGVDSGSSSASVSSAENVTTGVRTPGGAASAHPPPTPVTTVTDFGSGSSPALPRPGSEGSEMAIGALTVRVLDTVMNPGTGTGTASPSSLNYSPVSLPAHFRARHLRHDENECEYHRGPSLSLSSTQSSPPGTGVPVVRPGSAGARLTGAVTGTGAGEESGRNRDRKRERGQGTHAKRGAGAGAAALGLGATRSTRSLVSRASSVLLRRLSQAAIGSVRGAGSAAGASGGAGVATPSPGSPSRAREPRVHAGRALVERWKDRSKDEREVLGGTLAESEAEGEAEGEVMLIGSPHADVFNAP